MTDAPERLWCWNFQTEQGSWDRGWGGYARPENRFPMDERERNTGAEYIRADLVAALNAELATERHRRQDEKAKIQRQRDQLSAMQTALRDMRSEFVGVRSKLAAIQRDGALDHSEAATTGAKIASQRAVIHDLEAEVSAGTMERDHLRALLAEAREGLARLSSGEALTFSFHIRDNSEGAELRARIDLASIVLAKIDGQEGCDG